MMSYVEVYVQWEKDLEGFWLEVVEVIDWVEVFKIGVIDKGNGFYEWFVDVKVNICWNVLDCYVEVG